MELPIRMGIAEVPSLIEINGTRLQGVWSTLYFVLHYFIWEKTNYTFLPLPDTTYISCSDRTGNCTGRLTALQAGDVDYIGETILNYVNALGDNLTSLPAVIQEDCYFVYTRKLKIVAEAADFCDFLDEFPLLFWFLLTGVFAVLIFMSLLIIKQQTSVDITSALWYQFDFIMGQNTDFISNCLTNQKYFFVAYIVSILLTSTLLSSSIVTGLVQRPDYVRLQTFKDVIKHKYIPMIEETSLCGVDFLKSNDPDARKVAKTAIQWSGEGLNFQGMYDKVRERNKFQIILDFYYKHLKSFGCVKNPFLEIYEPLVTSDTPLFQIYRGYLINKNSPDYVKKIIMRGTYALIEFKLYDNDYVKRRMSEHVAGSKPPPPCLGATNIEPQALYTPIDPKYLSIGFAILVIGLTLGILSFLSSLITDK